MLAADAAPGAGDDRDALVRRVLPWAGRVPFPAMASFESFDGLTPLLPGPGRRADRRPPARLRGRHQRQLRALGHPRPAPRRGLPRRHPRRTRPRALVEADRLRGLRRRRDEARRVALFDHLGLDDVLLVGYSMGAHLVVAAGARRAAREGGGAAGHRRRRRTAARAGPNAATHCSRCSKPTPPTTSTTPRSASSG